jgi:hypothetical protein
MIERKRDLLSTSAGKPRRTLLKARLRVMPSGAVNQPPDVKCLNRQRMGHIFLFQAGQGVTKNNTKFFPNW